MIDLPGKELETSGSVKEQGLDTCSLLKGTIEFPSNRKHSLNLILVLVLKTVMEVVVYGSTNDL